MFAEGRTWRPPDQGALFAPPGGVEGSARPNSYPGGMPLRTVVLLVLGCTACGPSAPEVEPLGRPPVVLILFDALHAAHLSHLGYERDTTPALDALAADGVSFAHAFSPAPYTLASIPSLLTGRLPDSHGVTSTRATLRAGEITLAEVLAGAGYRTVAAVSQPNGGRSFGNAQGFEEFQELWVPRSPAEVEHVVPRTGEEMRVSKASDFPPIVSEFLAADDGRPLFMYLHVLEPHSPYAMPAEFRSRWLDPAYDGPFAAGDSLSFVRTGDSERDDYWSPGAADLQAAVDLYDANLAWADHNLELVLEELRAAGVYEESLIIVTSDHGEAMWQHGRWGHNEDLYDEMLRVPLIVKLPAGRGPEGHVHTALVSTVDVLPSVCHWLDLVQPDFEPLDGRTIAPMLADVAWEPAPRELRLRSHHRIPHVALRASDRKTIAHRDPQTGTVKKVEHYRLDEDPGETIDLADERAGGVSADVERLEDWIRGATLSRAERDIPLTVMEEKMLEMLGYTSGQGE